jgi:hypothetical protein
MIKSKICQNPSCFASFVPFDKNDIYCETCKEKLKFMGLDPRIKRVDDE